MEREVDNQVAAPAETRTPNLHRAKPSLIESADGRVATVANSAGEKPCPTKKQKNPLDSDRPSHGRRYRNFAPFVRQTGERKAQTCANAILHQLKWGIYKMPSASFAKA
jgi:hypothetical protein